MRLGLFVLTVALIAALATGCTRSTGGHAKANPAHAGKTIVTTDIDAIVVAPQQLVDIVGAPIRPRLDQKRPVGGGPAGPCAALGVVGTDAFVGGNYAALRVIALSDDAADQHRHVVAQSVAVYADGQTAAKQFGAATANLDACNGRRVNDQAYWKFGIDGLTPDGVRWNKTETDVPWQWVCAGDGRVRSNVVVEAMVCQSDPTSAQNAQTIVDRMSAVVWDLSSPNRSR
ncbi:sensor domain-containing protein [Mycobacterium sp.]|uniref:sensor domain-containing protein n=1 Tax=Mycobacterium sp. TaxID=1785 RepID=UPI002D29D635|nr:sensor domain-containing protein [Mycobacterium sp.]HZA12037.1 sensor domain-containing protein [Mycobacterium sp.]